MKRFLTQTLPIVSVGVGLAILIINITGDSAERLGRLEATQMQVAEALGRLVAISEATENRQALFEGTQLITVEAIGKLTGEINGLNTRLADFSERLVAVDARIAGWTTKIETLPFALVGMHRADIDALARLLSSPRDKPGP